MNEPLNPEVAILNAALELPNERRARYLDKACAEDAALRQQVEALLQSHEQAGGFLEAPPAGFDFKRTEPVQIPLTEKPGDRIGRFKLLEQIGEGGCGVVYLAEQEEPVRRRVALKVIKLGMDTKSVIARFEAERQALALMDHPNIAKVFDAGSTERPVAAGVSPAVEPGVPPGGKDVDNSERPESSVASPGGKMPPSTAGETPATTLTAGRPYFVMELVHGVKITEFCDENKLSTPDRLKLFIQVCRAIQHAHQKGIIHRDIKPSNILVTVNDGVPVPKVIDFGIAKATQGRLTDQTLFTAFEQFIGTPAYMSPEQAAMTSLDIDTRSDIYSLGVLLYELLTGRTPFDQKELLAAGLDEMRRTIREVEPIKPSTRLTQNRSQAFGSAQSQIANRKPQIPTDLDWIVMKCLEKDRSRRYATANGLAADLQRHLNHEPVTARPPTRLYRFQKLVRRNKLAAAAISVLAVAVLIVAVGSSVAAWRVAGARRAEQGEREKAEAANLQLRGTVRLLELERAEDFFRDHDSAQGVAHLAAMLRRDPSNHIAANRLVSALVHRDWALPLAAPMRHLGQVESVSFSPDGQRVVSTSRDGTAKLWDAATGRALATVRHRDRIDHAHHSPDGTRFVTASADGTARIWSATNGAALTPPLTHTGRVNWAEFSADGQSLVTASSDMTARVWDAASGALIRELRGHTSPVIMARFSPVDGRRIVTGGWAGSIRLWSVDTGETLLRVEDRRTNLTALAFSPDGRRLVAACVDGIARLWDADSGQPVANPLKHKDPIDHAAFSPDSRLVLTTSQDGTARLWEAKTGVPIGLPLVHPGVIFGAFSPGGETVVTTSRDSSARLWSVGTGTPLSQLFRERARISHADFSPDGRRLVTASYGWYARVWDIQPRHAAPMELHAGQKIDSVAFSPDGEFLLTGGEDGTARQWDALIGQPRGEPVRHTGWVHHVAFSPDGRQFVSASTSRSTQVRDAATGQVVAGPFRHARGLWSAAFSPDGGRVATASADGTARVWSIAASQAVTPPLEHPSEVRLARFSPDGRKLLTVCKEHARVWDAQSGAPVTDPLAHTDDVKWAEFSPDGERILTASTDNTACLWDVRTGRLAAPLLRHAGIVKVAAFSPDGRRVATASSDRTARVWSDTGEALTPPLPHDSTLAGVRFSPDGRRLLTVATDGRARMWDVETGRPLTEWFDQGRVFGVAFDATGARVALGGRAAHVWAVPSAPVPVPEWFAEFAEGVAGVRFDGRGNATLVPGTELDQTAQRLPPEGAGDFYERLARWFLADPAKRPPSPF
jgi:WD40 repeat protein/serine/threonine protein kinase